MEIWSKSKAGLLVLSLALSALAHGQSTPAASVPNAPVPSKAWAPSFSALDLDPRRAEVTQNESSHFEYSKPFMHRVVPAGLGPQPLTSEQKIRLSLQSRISLGGVGSSILSAGEQQLFNSRPHYGTDSGAFGQRLGAAELKQVTESFFSYGVYAAAFHEDPHYYVMGPGPGHTVVHRAIYSASRAVLTSTDEGNTSINWAKLAGEATAVGLTNTYYPREDSGFADTMGAYGSSLAGTVLGLELHEFLPDLVRLAFHRHKGTDQ